MVKQSYNTETLVICPQSFPEEPHSCSKQAFTLLMPEFRCPPPAPPPPPSPGDSVAPPCHAWLPSLSAPPSFSPCLACSVSCSQMNTFHGKGLALCRWDQRHNLKGLGRNENAQKWLRISRWWPKSIKPNVGHSRVWGQLVLMLAWSWCSVILS